jgi:hypothetical protein
MMRRLDALTLGELFDSAHRARIVSRTAAYGRLET